MLYYYLYVATIEEKRLVEVAVPGSRYPMENYVIKVLFASVFVGIVCLPEAGDAKPKLA